ncbi:MAG: tetratricopeptide repeat protein [Saprospiraceae bacterium]|nr:tetratricopeptide repeat protein [Saprospiraceae bacterium]
MLLSFSLLEEGRKGAYKHYYKGNYYYSEGRFDKAVYHFSQAYDAIPTEFNFALAYAVGLGRVGKTSDSQALLKRSINLLSDRDPEYRQKTALLYFFEGVTYTYAKQYGQAMAALKKGISVQEELGKPNALSVMYNTLGYVTFMNQGQGAHKSQDRPLHYHLRKDDLQRAYDIFKLALQKTVATKPPGPTSVCLAIRSTCRPPFLIPSIAPLKSPITTTYPTIPPKWRHLPTTTRWSCCSISRVRW